MVTLNVDHLLEAHGLAIHDYTGAEAVDSDDPAWIQEVHLASTQEDGHPRSAGPRHGEHSLVQGNHVTD